MKVWVLLDVDYDVTSIKGVFSSEERAKKYRAIQLADSTLWWDIEAVTFNACPFCKDTFEEVRGNICAPCRCLAVADGPKEMKI